MVSSTHPPIAIVVALRDEERALRRILDRAGSARSGSGRLPGSRVILVRTGIGADRARAGVASLIEAERPGAVLVTGYGGALRPGLHPGDVLVAREVLAARGRLEGHAGSPLAPAIADARLLDAASRIRIETGRVIIGRLVSADRVLASSSEKRRAGEALGANACDMESHAALQAAAEAGVPALAARAILDEQNLDLPFDFQKLMTPEGAVRPFLLLRTAAANPRGAFRLAALGNRARRASASLAAFTRAFLAVAGEPVA